MQGFQKSLILPLLILLGIVCYDHLSLLPSEKEERFSHTETRIKSILSENQKNLLDSKYTELFSKPELEIDELNKLKLLLDELEQNSIQVKLLKDEKLVFWTEEYSKYNFCEAFQTKDFTGSICYAPFNAKGYAEISTLQNDGFDYYFKRGVHKGHDEIDGVPITLGKKFRTSLQENLIITLYFLAFFLTLILSVKYSAYWPLVILGGVRALAILNNWSDRFAHPELTQLLNQNVQYNSIDLLLDSTLLFGSLFVITEQFITPVKNKLTTSRFASLSFLHILIFISHIRLVQVLVRGENTSLSIEDLGSTSISDLIIFFAVVLVQLGIFHFGYALFKSYKTSTKSKSELYITYAVSICTAVVMGYFLKLNLDPALLILFLFCYILLMDLFVDVRTRTITWVIWWGIFYAIYLSALFFNYDIKKEIRSRQAFLEKVFHNIPTQKIKDINQLGLPDTISTLVNDLLELPEGIEYNREDSRADLESYINQKLDREDIQLKLFDNQGQSLFDEIDYYSSGLNRLLKIDSLTVYDEIKNTIWTKKKLSDNKRIFIGFTLGKVESAFPFAFNYYRDGMTIINRQAISKNEIAQLPAEHSNVFYAGSDVYTVYRPSTGRLLVSKKSFLGLIKPIALFSFLFSIITIMMLVIGLLNVVFKFLPKDWPLFVQDIESLNSKIQISLILVILISFIIIASITSTFLKDYLAKEKDLVIRDKLENVARDFESRTKYSNAANETVEVVSNYKKQIEKIHNVDLEVYQVSEGNSKLNYFTQMFFQKQKEPFAFTETSSANTPVSYIPIWSGEEIAGVAALEMRSSIRNSKLNVFDFLGSIFNVYVFLFLIASVISIFIAQSITRPLSMLNQNLTQVKLGKQNKQLVWQRDDEIGILIGNYNKMVTKLEESAEILAKNERDSAWREMAKQVAHEIKNPLTPMKLSIQYLEKAIKQYPDDADKIAKKISRTMLEQIDNLTGIAEAFGNFAELPKTTNVRVELNNIVEVVHNLFRKREDMDIKLSVPIDPIYVHADKSQLVRILNNLVKNATEAIPSERRGLINLELTTRKEKAIIKVTDNGNGIPHEMKGKIFQPKFTTKDSGSGLGLAISANMIESMNGKIYFESEPDVSTSFYIELDLIRQPVVIDNKERITLD